MSRISPTPGLNLASYLIEERIGTGGMSEVYRALDTRLDRPVALKVLSDALAADEGFRERLMRESRIAAGLDHPNVVPIYEAGEADGRLFIAMRYVDGTDLRALLRGTDALPLERVIALVGQVGDVLDAAHTRGLVHRDVKPSNVLIDDPGGRDHCYLADFGLSQSAAHRGPAEERLTGTIDYVAPEQIRGDELDGRADQYALGCLLFECLTGRPPFSGRSDVATLFAHLEEPPPAASDRRPGLPEALDGVIARALAKVPDERHPTCRALVDEAGHALGLETRRRAPRRVALVGVLAAVLVTLAAILAIVVTGDGEVAAAPAAGSVVGIDPSSNEVTTRYDLPAVPGSVVTGSGRVWVAAYTDGSLWQVNPSTGDIARQPSVGNPRDLAFNDGKVYVAGDGPELLAGNVVAYDAASGAREDGVELNACSITAGANVGVWASGCPNVEQLRSGSDGLAIARELTLPYEVPATTGNTRMCQCDMTVGAGDVWVAGDAADPRIWRLDARRAEVDGVVRVPFAIRSIASTPGAIWVTGPLDDVIARIDVRTGQVTDTIPVGGGAAGVAASGDAVFVANQLDGTVSRVDARTREVVATIEVGGRPTELAASDGGVWVTVDGG
jgi:YVTN family beta-propeller protein